MSRVVESRRLAKRQKQTHLLNEAQERVAMVRDRGVSEYKGLLNAKLRC